MKVKWGILGIIVALLVLAGSIFFTGIKISTILTSKTKNVQQQAKREAIAFIYAFRKNENPYWTQMVIWLKCILSLWRCGIDHLPYRRRLWISIKFQTQHQQPA